MVFKLAQDLLGGRLTSCCILIPRVHEPLDAVSAAVFLNITPCVKSLSAHGQQLLRQGGSLNLCLGVFSDH